MGVTVAVVGGTGTVGRAVVKAFLDNGYDVRAIGRGRVDVAADPLDGIFDGCDAVVNAAGSCWGLTEEELEYQHVRLVNRILGALRGTLIRLVHIGSIHEYGPVPRGRLIDETVAPQPVSAYARAKLAGSRAVLAAHDVDRVVLRAANVIGPHTGRHGFLAALMADKPVTVAEARRDYVDVRDLAVAVILAASAPVNGRVINIGSGVATDLRELARLVRAHESIVDGPAASNGGEWTCVDIRLAERLLRWRPRYTLRESANSLMDSAT
jgi:nucleoside-diphosphate-sugar epimerase